MPPGKKSPSAQGYADKPFEAHVQRINPSSEKISVDSAAGPDDVVVPHPMLSTNSWIRAIPEKGARVITVSTAGGTLRRVVVGYFSRAAADLITRYKSGAGLYRPLKAGEWDMMTPGVAYIYGTVQGKLHLRGGPVHQILDPQRLHMRSRAPTFRRELHENFDNVIMDEERFGVVVRHTNAPSEKNRWLRAPDSKKNEVGDLLGPKTNRQPFGKEYLRILGRDKGGGETPEVQRLVALIEGDVFDDTGKEIKHSKSNKGLRHLRELYDKDGKVIHQVEIDKENGAIAHEGTADTIDLTQKLADVTIQLQSLAEKISKSMTIDAGSSIDVKASTTGRYSGKTSTILGPAAAPVDAAMLGTTFNTTIMTPLLTALVSVLSAAGASLTTGGTTPPFVTNGGPAMAAAGGALTAAATTLSALAGSLPSTLSTNVKVSKA